MISKWKWRLRRGKQHGRLIIYSYSLCECYKSITVQLFSTAPLFTNKCLIYQKPLFYFASILTLECHTSTEMKQLQGGDHYCTSTPRPLNLGKEGWPVKRHP
jgi:hypothetical protein